MDIVILTCWILATPEWQDQAEHLVNLVVTVMDQRIEIMVTDKDSQIHLLPHITPLKTVPPMVELEVVVTEDPLMVEEDLILEEMIQMG